MHGGKANLEIIEKTAQRAREWVNSPDGRAAMEEVKRKWNDYLEVRIREREEKPPIDIYEPFMVMAGI